MKKYVETEIKNLRHQLDGMQCGSCHHDTVVRLLPIIRQENSMLFFGRAKLTVTNIDTTKLSIYEYGKSFLSPHFDFIPKMPETLLNFRPDYTQSFPVDRFVFA